MRNGCIVLVWMFNSCIVQVWMYSGCIVQVWMCNDCIVQVWMYNGCIVQVLVCDDCIVQVWMCNGSILLTPCSHVGHIFRATNPITWSAGNPVLRSNMRVAEVWLDRYKHYYYEAFSSAKVCLVCRLSLPIPLSLCLFLRSYVCLSVYLFLRLYVSLSVSPIICLSVYSSLILHPFLCLLLFLECLNSIITAL